MDSFTDFQIIREIARGSMGVVYQARMADGREVAVKTFTMVDTATDEEQQRLHKLLDDEARRAMTLEHPSIIATFDYVDRPENPAPYIVMEYVNSPNLSIYLKKNPRIEVGVAINLLRQAASALDYSARMGLIHRDVKPANMLILDGGTSLKLIDFGIAKRIREESLSTSSTPSLTETHSRVGTLPFMAPEQITEPRRVTEKIDQYALASVAYLLLTGRTVFEDSTSDASLTHAIVHKEPPRPSEFNETLKGRVDKVMRRALAKKPAMRFSDCTAFVGALEEAVFSKAPVIPMWGRLLPAGLALGGLLAAGIWYTSRPSGPVPVEPTGPTGSSGPVVTVTDPPPNDPPQQHGTAGTLRTGGDPVTHIDPPPPPPAASLELSVFSRETRLSQGKEFGYKDPELGQLDGRELTAHVNAVGRLPARAKAELEWFVDGAIVGSQDLDLKGDQSGVQLRYPNPIPLPGAYTVRLTVTGQKSKEFRFKITQ